MRKHIKIGIFIMIQILIVAVCVLLGRYSGITAQKQQLLTIEKIALVNLDEGIEIDHSIRNYGAEFLSGLDDHYEMTGLEQARTGLANGLYAAYIIIPATFSKNIESINGKPVKSNIVYKINNNLDEHTRENVIADITSLNSSLSTDIEYVFLDALLKEVHNVQDYSDTILENDINDLKNVLTLAESELVVDPDYPEEKSASGSINALDLSEEYSAIQSIFAKLSSSYRQDEKKAQEAYSMIIGVKDEVDKEMNAMDTEIRAIDRSGAGNQYIDNAEELKEILASYNDELADWENANHTQVKKNFEEYLDSYDKSVNAQLSSLSDKHKEHLADFYADILAGREEDEVSFNYDNAGEANYLDVSELASYHYFMQIGSENITYKKEYKDLSGKIKDLAEKVKKKPYLYEVEKDGKKTEETGYLMTAADVDQLMKWVNDLKEVNNIEELGTLKNQFAGTQKSDISTIVRLAEQQKNMKFMESQKSWFYDDLVYYGAQDAESIESYVTRKQYTEFSRKEVEDIVNHFYRPDFKIVVKGTIPEKAGSTETVVEEESTSNPVTTENFTEETEEKTEASTESQTTQTDDGKTEEEEILFKGTNELPVLDEEQLNTSIVKDILKPVQDNITASYENMKKEWENLSTGLGEFNIENYVDDHTKDDLRESFDTNVSSIENTVGEKEREYAEYTNEVEEVSKENLTAWQETIKKANETTHSNIDKSLSGIKANRESINENNSILLTDITNALPYTRLGELENKEVYSFMTNPVEYQNISEDKKIIMDEQSEDEKDYRPVFIGMAVSVLLFGGFLIVRITGKKRNNNIRNQNPDLL